MTRFGKRPGLSLIEVLLAVLVFCVLLGLLLPAVQRVREAANRTSSMNNLRQIILATHQFADNHKKMLPSLEGGMFSPPDCVQDYLEQYASGSAAGFQNGTQQLKIFISPSDPSVYSDRVLPLGTLVSDNQGEKKRPLCSYPANASVFVKQRPYPVGVPDGTSVTIGFAEHYSVCYDTAFFYAAGEPGGGLRRPAFADRGAYPQRFEGTVSAPLPPYVPTEFGVDVVPVTTPGDPPVTRASTPGLTFQARPALAACNPLLPQTPHASGMLVALMDGSVRSIRPDVQETVFWAAVTPAAGDATSID